MMVPTRYHLTGPRDRYTGNACWGVPDSSGIPVRVPACPTGLRWYHLATLLDKRLPRDGLYASARRTPATVGFVGVVNMTTGFVSPGVIGFLKATGIPDLRTQ